ncbi:rhythmically expressed gene 2 protein-like [Leptidea sinapis]|uniref:Haloacid dehalogenase-like hydrolase domain-containing protein 3 n=1 Tax=Leptidea sinapis TaxID=189913 RepID=A0A5E4PLH4_9NEOP|nr:rhythmically expressed gene 2 protein-like [Leptidea sinapis]VVC86169.1 unnamed protein product [Leptidea sinapis]
MILSGVKLITFDATNTLLKFKKPPWDYYTAVAQQFGYTIDNERVRIQFLDSLNKLSNEHPNFGRKSIKWEKWWRCIVQLTFQDTIPNDKITEIGNILIHDFTTSKCWCPAKGAEELLQYLHKKNVCVGVISNFDPRLHQILCNFKIKSYLKFILTSYEIDSSKPNKIIFDRALKQSMSNVSPFECLHIGDNLEKDYLGAKNAGWHAILINENITEKDINLLNLTETSHNQILFNNLEELNDTLKIKMDKH